MCNFVEGAVRENRDMAMYDIVYGVPAGEWFDSSYVNSKLNGLGISSSVSSVEAHLKSWASDGLLNRESGLYQAV